MSQPDPLLCLRSAIARSFAIATLTSATPGQDPEPDLAKATHAQFEKDIVFPLSAPTRFESNDEAFNLRSIYFAWLKRDVAITEYITATKELDDALREAGQDGVRHLPFGEKADLLTWLEGHEDSEYIKPLPASAAGVAGDAGEVVDVAMGGTGLDSSLQNIYSKERKLGDRNSVLRGIKPTDFSHIRKMGDELLRSKKNGRTTTQAPTAAAAAGGATAKGKTGRRQDPIILVSPSASAILRMSNIKEFLEKGEYKPPETGSSGQNLLQVSRVMPKIDHERPFRFHLVDSPDQFRPDYWSRVVAVFTTGQNWQFKSYKWSQPGDLFANVGGIYVGWEREVVPPSVSQYGASVAKIFLEPYNPKAPVEDRWRDKEKAELTWGTIQDFMLNKGWTRHGVPV